MMKPNLKRGNSTQVKKSVTLPEEKKPESVNWDIDEIVDKEKSDTLERNPERKHPDVLSESHRAEKYYELFDENKRLKVF